MAPGDSPADACPLSKHCSTQLLGQVVGQRVFAPQVSGQQCVKAREGRLEGREGGGAAAAHRGGQGKRDSQGKGGRGGEGEAGGEGAGGGSGGGSEVCEGGWLDGLDEGGWEGWMRVGGWWG